MTVKWKAFSICVVAICIFTIVSFKILDPRALDKKVSQLNSTIAQNNTEEKKLKQAIFEISKVLGKIDRGDCSYVKAELLAKHSISTGVPPSIAAAIMGVESRCDTFAISDKGAVGLMQIHIKSWKSTIDFTSNNVFNDEVNIDIALRVILAPLIKQYGIRGAILNYNNMNQDYANKVCTLSGYKGC